MGVRVVLVRFLFILIPVEVGRVLPELRGADSEIGVHFRLVPIDTILHFIALTRVINHKALIVRRALVHNLTEKLKRRKGRAIIVKDALSVC